MLFNEREKVRTRKLKIPKAFPDYSQTTDDVYKNLEDYNRTMERKVLIVFDDMIADMEPNKKLSPTITKLFFKRKTTEHLACFYFTILFQSAKN